MLHHITTRWCSPQDTSPPLCLFLHWHHTTIRSLDCHGDSSSTQCGRRASSGWLAKPTSAPPPHQPEEDTAGNQTRPPTYLPPTGCPARWNKNQSAVCDDSRGREGRRGRQSVLRAKITKVKFKFKAVQRVQRNRYWNMKHKYEELSRIIRIFKKWRQKLFGSQNKIHKDY